MRTPASPSRMDLVSRSDLTPYIHVVVVLLIIAATLTPSMTGHGPSLPHATTAELIKETRPTILVTFNHSYYVESERWSGIVEADELAPRLRQVLAGRPAHLRTIHVSADHQAPYRDVLAVVDAAQKAGVRRLDLIAAVPRPRPVR